MEIGCTLKLPDDAENGTGYRSTELSILTDGANRKGKWRINSDSSDPRLAIGEKSGTWVLNYSPDDDLTTLYVIRDSDYKILMELYGVSRTMLAKFGCGTSIAGDGLHLGPPRSAVRFALWFSCI